MSAFEIPSTFNLRSTEISWCHPSMIYLSHFYRLCSHHRIVCPTFSSTGDLAKTCNDNKLTKLCLFRRGDTMVGVEKTVKWLQQHSQHPPLNSNPGSSLVINWRLNIVISKYFQLKTKLLSFSLSLLSFLILTINGSLIFLSLIDRVYTHIGASKSTTEQFNFILTLTIKLKREGEINHYQFFFFSCIYIG